MKKKGFTMVELMISIAMIAVVMVFLVQLLVDVKYDFTNELYNTANQLNRAEIIKTIQNDWIGKELKAVNPENTIYQSYYNNKDIVLVASDNSFAVISIVDSGEKQYIKYKSTKDSDFKYKWYVEKNNNETKISKTNIPYKLIRNTVYNETTKQQELVTNDYIVEINIQMIIDNSELRRTNDSRLDNIVLTFYGANENELKNISLLYPTQNS